VSTAAFTTEITVGNVIAFLGSNLMSWVLDHLKFGWFSLDFDTFGSSVDNKFWWLFVDSKVRFTILIKVWSSIDRRKKYGQQANFVHLCSNNRLSLHQFYKKIFW